MRGEPAGESEGGEPKTSDPGEGIGHAVMAELAALRRILLNVLFKLANGQTLTAEEMQRLIDRGQVEEGAGAAPRSSESQKGNSKKNPDLFFTGAKSILRRSEKADNRL